MKTKYTFAISIAMHFLFIAVAVALVTIPKPPIDEEITLDLTMSSEERSKAPITHTQASVAKLASSSVMNTQAAPVLTQNDKSQILPLQESVAGESAPKSQTVDSSIPVPIVIAKAESPVVHKIPALAQPVSIPKEIEDEYLDKHLGAIRDILVKYRKYPTQALRLKQEGVVKVSFRLKSSGDVEDIRIVSGSGSQLLDDNARELIEKTAQYFPTPPKSVRITVPLSYGIKTT